MALLSTQERTMLQAVADVAYGNPFLPEQVAHEQRALGADFVATAGQWNMRGNDPHTDPVNTLRLTARVEPLMQQLRDRLQRGMSAPSEDLLLYEDAVLFLLFYRYAEPFYEVMVRALDHKSVSFRFYQDFHRDWAWYFQVPGFPRAARHEAAHVFACYFQVRRAFHHIFRYIVGGSQAAARLRASVWQSIFTHDMRRYRRLLYDRMGDFTTLIIGPSGTGKELVARAIGLSRYIPFQPETQTFAEDFTATFHPLNLSALPSTLIESELFGHRRGTFTGAVQDRRGWLELCRPLGTIFLDEIGDLEAAVQVKLLRLLQTRTFQPLGETTERHFSGKLMAATNRDLAAAIQQGRFRADFYYRLCSDLIVTPSLSEQLQESPEVLHTFILYIAQRLVGTEAERLTAEVEHWVDRHLGRAYPWPGNIRELEQCVRNVLIRQTYHPLQCPAQAAHDTLARLIQHGTLTAEALLRRYCTLVFAQTGSYLETARRLQVDRRTVKSKIDPQLLAQLRPGDMPGDKDA